MIRIVEPTLKDIVQIYQLNQKYLMSLLSDENKPKGFVRIGYSLDDIERIVGCREIVIAFDQERIVGYYLIGKKSGSPDLKYQLQKVAEIFTEVESVGFGAQAVIEFEYRGGNILSLMFEKLLEVLNGKYKVLFSSVTKTNGIALKAHVKGGYRIVDQDDVLNYVAYNIDKV